MMLRNLRVNQKRSCSFHIVLLRHLLFEPRTTMKKSNHPDTTILWGSLGYMERPCGDAMAASPSWRPRRLTTTQHTNKKSSKWFWPTAVTAPPIIKSPQSRLPPTSMSRDNCPHYALPNSWQAGTLSIIKWLFVSKKIMSVT